MRSTVRSALLAVLFCRALVPLAVAQTATVVPANEAAAHISEYATVEGIVAKVFTSKSGSTFLNIGATYPNQTFTGWIPAGIAGEQIARAHWHRRQDGADHRQNRALQRQTRNPDQCRLAARGRLSARALPWLDFMQRRENECGIDLSPPALQQLCAALNEFALPRAIVDFEDHSFIAWNPKFIEHTGFSEDELKLSKTDDLLSFGESWFPLSGSSEGQDAEYVVCTARRPFGGDPTPGFAVRAHEKIGYVMLDVFKPSAQFEQGRNTGREEVRNQIARAFHEEISSSILAALFLLQTAKSELEDAGSPQAEDVSKAADILTETTEKIADVLRPTEQSAD
jgi:PAS domain-containing protein